MTTRLVRPFRFYPLLAFSLAALALLAFPSNIYAQGAPPDGEPGVSAPDGEPGFSPGSTGMDESEPATLALVNKARAKYGATSVEYMQELLNLGMFYNRQERSRDAVRVLLKSLALADAGNLKVLVAREAREAHARKIAAAKSSATPPAGGGVSSPGDTVSSPINTEERRVDVEFLQSVLPPLAEAEIKLKLYPAAETHIKRYMTLAQQQGAAGKINLVSAYWQYAELLSHTGRRAQAEVYKKKGDAINSTFIGL